MEKRVIETKWVQFQSSDGLLLPGMIFEPTVGTKKVVINLHGNGSASVFYGFDRAASFARKLNEKGIAFFAFNNRGAHYIKKLVRVVGDKEEEVRLGTAYELIKDCVMDIDGAVEFLSKMGYEEFYLVGHSTGANKVCVYNHYKPQNKIAKYVLLGGGDDTGLYYDMIGSRERFFNYLKRAREEVEKGEGNKLVPKYMVNYMLSYQSFLDMCDPDGDYSIFPFNEYMNKLGLAKKKLFGEYGGITKPTLVVYGEKDEYCYGDATKAVGILRENDGGRGNFEYKVIKEADHGFRGLEDEVAELVAEWL